MQRNTLITLSDNKIGIDQNADNRADFYTASVLSATDYYAFGMSMKERSWQSESYRYGFNGKENDTDWDVQDYGFRIYKPELGKFLSVDPIAREYPFYSPYHFAGNSPISGIDLDGLEYLNSNEATVEFRHGAVMIKKENLSRWSKGNLFVANQNHKNWGAGMIGANKTLANDVFGGMTSNNDALKFFDKMSKISLSSSFFNLDPSLSPAPNVFFQQGEGRTFYQPNLYTQQGKGNINKFFTTKITDANRTAYNDLSFALTPSNSKSLPSTGKGALAVGAITTLLDTWKTLATQGDEDLVKEHFEIAREIARGNIVEAINLGIIPKEFQNNRDLSDIANIVLQGKPINEDATKEVRNVAWRIVSEIAGNNRRESISDVEKRVNQQGQVSQDQTKRE